MVSPSRTVLEALRAAAGPMTVAEIREATGLPDDQASSAIRSLNTNSLVRNCRLGTYEVTEAGRAAALSKVGQGKPLAPHSKAQALPARLWRALRMVKAWSTVPELLELLDLPQTDVRVRTARRYLRALTKAGVTEVSRFRSGARELRYRLVQDPGPKVPVHRVRARAIWEPNSGRTLPLPTQGGRRDG